MFPEAEGIAFLHLDDRVFIHGELELTHHHKGFFVADNHHIWPPEQNFLDGARMVRLQMVDDQIIQRTARQNVLHVFKKLTAAGPVHRVEQSGLFVQQKIGVIGDTSGNGICIFKQGKAVVVGPYPVHILGYISYTIHICSSLRFYA
ncbi:hypothetical protein SDC9_192075 [bioreactor metagenome]|uniref:Uncharacterized protein n=1 Tax=bioreactor metagenome TaxID=1076179 RepID=A0A645I013_9ZZZZ